MPALTNPRHERFLDEIETGKTGTDAYATAFNRKPDATARASASRLLAQPNVKARLAERQEARAQIAREASGKAVEALAIDREWVMARLIENASKAAQQGDFGPSNQALNLLGKELGMFIDRSESKVAIETHEDRLDRLSKKFAETRTTAH